jgi:hypothetical protein
LKETYFSEFTIKEIYNEEFTRQNRAVWKKNLNSSLENVLFYGVESAMWLLKISEPGSLNCKPGQSQAYIRIAQGGFTKGERTSSLLYIYSRCTCKELFQRSVAPLVVKFGIWTGIEKGNEEGRVRGNECGGREPV